MDYNQSRHVGLVYNSKKTALTAPNKKLLLIVLYMKNKGWHGTCLYITAHKKVSVTPGDFDIYFRHRSQKKRSNNNKNT